MSNKPQKPPQTNYRKQYLTTPITYPELKKPLMNYKKEHGRKDDIAKFSVLLFNKQRTSIYKKLFNRISQQHQDMSFNAQDIRTIRNMYLKRLVESNADNFPIELCHDEYKTNILSKEDKIASVLTKMKEAGKNEKIRKDPLDMSRKASINLNLDRKESVDEYLMLRKKQKGMDIDILKDMPKGMLGDKGKNAKEKIDETDSENNDEEDDEDDKNNHNGKEGDQSFEDDDLINDENVENDDSQNMNDEDDGGMDEGGEY